MVVAEFDTNGIVPKSSDDTEIIPLREKPYEEKLSSWISTALKRTGEEITKVVILVDDQNVEELVEALKTLTIPAQTTNLTILSKDMLLCHTLVQIFGP